MKGYRLFMSVKFSFVILTWNRASFLDACLTALSKSIANQESCEIIVLDNGSTDSTNEILMKHSASKQPQLKVIALDENYGIKAYKRLFRESKGQHIVTVDDDVLEFPANIDLIFGEYMETFRDYGYLALDVVQDKYTDGARADPERYTDDIRDGKTVHQGPTGGWCSCFRRRDFAKIKYFFYALPLSMRLGEDGALSFLFKRILRLKCGIIKNVKCFHACGPYYAKKYNYLDREIAKYSRAGLVTYVEKYKNMK